MPRKTNINQDKHCQWKWEDKKFKVGDFSKIDFSGTGKIIIEQNNSESLVVEAEEDVIRT